MNSQESVIFFDTYVLTVPKGLKARTEGLPGQRKLYLSREDGSVLISFGEDMELMDLKPLPPTTEGTVCSYQCCRGGKYIHLRRSTSPEGCLGYFHIELEDGEGRTLSLPGQMTASPVYPWSDGLEPILLELMDGLALG